MKHLLLLILPLLSLLPSQALAITGDSAIFDFSKGAPIVADNTTSTCNDTATVRYDFSAGQSVPVFDTTANCTATPAAGGGGADEGIIWFTDE